MTSRGTTTATWEYRYRVGGDLFEVQARAQVQTSPGERPLWSRWEPVASNIVNGAPTSRLCRNCGRSLLNPYKDPEEAALAWITHLKADHARKVAWETAEWKTPPDANDTTEARNDA